MKIYSAWKSCLENIQTQEDYKSFWDNYLKEEQKIYESILETKNPIVSGSIDELSKTFNVEAIVFAGFLDGINTSLKEEIDLENLEDTDSISIEIVYKKLFFNMLDAKAKWLYTLEIWNSILTQEEQKEIKKEYKSSKTFVNTNKVGRNEPCPCGSGKKYKKCCGKNN